MLNVTKVLSGAHDHSPGFNIKQVRHPTQFNSRNYDRNQPSQISNRPLGRQING
jgi:hypothetical protein